MWRTATAALISAAALGGCAGTGTPDLITRDGALAPCAGPYCVSSLDPDPDQRIEPIRYAGTRDAARNALLRIVAQTEGAAIVTQTVDYVHVEYRSQIMQFVDDLELMFPLGQKVVHLRSASRSGYYDFSVNRKRVEALRSAFDAVQP